MTRTFMWVVAVGGLAAAAIVTVRNLSTRGDDSALRGQLTELDAEVQRLRADVGRRQKVPGVALPRLTAAPPVNPAAPVETPDEQDQRVEREARQHEAKLALYYDRLDRDVRLLPAAPEQRAALQKNVEALAKVPRTALIVDGYACVQSLCRLEVRRRRDVGPGDIVPAIRRLTDGMAELSMRPFDGDRSVIYAAPRAHKLPSVDL